ncbi:MAG: nitrous oxide-stimulated promoter family protein [Candidatus Hermodarchaeota archaeon]
MSPKDDRLEDPKIQKEKETVERMIRYYCDSKHDSLTGSLCENCTDLLDYSHHRLDHCTYGEDKPTCRKCEIHCYRPIMREEIRRVMRFSGPRLALLAPADWIRHWINEHR